MRPYDCVVFAGTFDRLHFGHKHILRKANKLGKTVIIGVSRGDLLKNKSNRTLIQDYDTRIKQIKNFMENELHTKRYEITPIDDKYGGADTSEKIDALIISDEIDVVIRTMKLNELRTDNGLVRFDIVIIPRVVTKDGTPISSSRLRSGENISDDDILYIT